MIQTEFEALLSDTTKRILGDINWNNDEDKHRWNEPVRDREAYVPNDITAPVTDAVSVWRQFCVEASILHQGAMHTPPPVQLEMI